MTNKLRITKNNIFESCEDDFHNSHDIITMLSLKELSPYKCLSVNAVLNFL